MRLDTFLLADAATTAEGKLYIHGGGITKINVASLPVVLPNLAVVIRWLVEPEDLGSDHLAEFRLADPDGEALVARTRLPISKSEIEQTARVEGEEPYVQLGLSFGGLVFQKAGIYRIDVWLDDEVVRSMPLPVVMTTQDGLRATALPASPRPARPNRAQRRSKGG